MSGTVSGGKKAAAKNLSNDPDFYKRIGKIGGANSNTGGFAAKQWCTCTEIVLKHYKAQCAGKKGGKNRWTTKKPSNSK